MLEWLIFLFSIKTTCVSITNCKELGNFLSAHTLRFFSQLTAGDDHFNDAYYMTVPSL